MEHSSDLTVEAMMLDSQASDLDKEERPEVFFFLCGALLSLSVCSTCVSLLVIASIACVCFIFLVVTMAYDHGASALVLAKSD